MMLCPLRLDIDEMPSSAIETLIEGYVKQHSRIDFSDEDTVLSVYFKQGVEWVENATLRAVIAREHRLVLREFPNTRYNEIRLPRGRAISVDSIAYYSGGSITEMFGPSSSSPPGSDYQEDLRGDCGGVLMPAVGSTWPSVDEDVPAPVTITFTAGWDMADIPATLLQAALLATEDAYNLRGSADYAAVNLADYGKSLATREALVSGYRLTRLY